MFFRYCGPFPAFGSVGQFDSVQWFVLILRRDSTGVMNKLFTYLVSFRVRLVSRSREQATFTNFYFWKFPFLGLHKI